MEPSPDMTPRQRSELIKRLAGGLGFAACGICSARPIERKDYVLAWLRNGRHGQMEYLARNTEMRLDPGLLLPGARSVIVVAWLYRVRETAEGLPISLEGDIPEQEGPTGRIARYAWGRDYHRVIRKRLHHLVDRLGPALRTPFDSRVCVDTAPLLERELARRAGIGWIGNNCLVLSRELGSYFCLGAVVTTLDLPPDTPVEDRCGDCDRCIQACPTNALVGGKRMDASRCLSYQTIENRGQIPPGQVLDPAGQVYGCDICQQVCPYNGPRAPVSIDADAKACWPAGTIDLQRVLAWDSAQWDSLTRGRALRRSTLEMWQRNARLVLERLRPAKR